MAKKFKLTAGTLLVCLAAVLGLAAFFMMFAPAVTGTGKTFGTQPVYSGTQVIFGYKSEDTQILNFNFLAFLGLFMLPLLGVCLTCLSVLKTNKIFEYVAAVLFVLGGILAFLTVSSFKSGVVDTLLYDIWTWKLGIGAVLSGVFGVLAGCAICLKQLLKA